jgi:hypothetical protein
MSNREAIDTITGYFYQFDKSLLELLKQYDDKASICMEGIEDIDVVSALAGELLFYLTTTCFLDLQNGNGKKVI